jgi:hypothetical protein
VSGSPNNPASSNNLNSDPLFVDPVGSDFRLAAISPAVNAGDNAQIPGDVTTDLAGHARIQQGTVDMGAFEVQPGDYQSVCRSGLAEGETYIFASTGVTATVDTLGSLSELCVTLSQSNHPDAPNGLQTGLYWTITRTASSEDWSLTLSALLTDTLATTDRLCRYSGTIWECGDAQNHSIDGNRITRSSVTQLSAWAVGSLAPTAATVDGFAAALHPDRVRLHWTTLNEVGLTGFHLYRGTDAAGAGRPHHRRPAAQPGRGRAGRLRLRLRRLHPAPAGDGLLLLAGGTAQRRRGLPPRPAAHRRRGQPARLPAGDRRRWRCGRCRRHSGSAGSRRLHVRQPTAWSGRV